MITFISQIYGGNIMKRIRKGAREDCIVKYDFETGNDRGDRLIKYCHKENKVLIIKYFGN